MERIRTAMQNHTVNPDIVPMTHEERAAWLAMQQAHLDEFLTSERRRFWA